MPVFCYDELSKKEAAVVHVNSVFLEEIVSHEVLEEEVLVEKTEKHFKTKVPRYIAYLYLKRKIWPKWVLLIRREDHFYKIDRKTKDRRYDGHSYIHGVLVHLGVYRNLREIIEILEKKYHMDKEELVSLLKRLVGRDTKETYPELYRWIVREVKRVDMIRIYDI